MVTPPQFVNWLTGTPKVIDASDLTFTQSGSGALTKTIDQILKLDPIHSLEFAKGDGSDDTVALQNWLNACTSNNRLGYLDVAPARLYIVRSPLVVSGAVNLNIVGEGNYTGSAIWLDSTTSDLLQINITGRTYLSNFGLRTVTGGATAGAMLNIGGAALTNVGGLLDRLSMQTCWNGIVSTSFGAYDIQFCDMAPNNIGMLIDTPGDSQIFDCKIAPQSASGIGISLTGAVAGSRILSNKINSGTPYDTAIKVVVGSSDGDFFVIGNSLEACSVGFSFDQAGGLSFGNVQIIGNEIASNGRPIYFPNATAGWVSRPMIIGNVLYGVTGVTLNAGSYFTIADNVIDGGGNLVIGASCANGTVHDNVMESGSISNSSPSVIVHDNPGYNPVGISAAVSTGVTGATITAGASPETHYIKQSATFNAAVTKGGQSIGTVPSANVPIVVQLGPFESYTVTWATTQPTYTKDVH